MTNQRKITRREAIKILGATAGASLLANLPSKWSTPELNRGVLPAHAQTSCTTVTMILNRTDASARIALVAGPPPTLQPQAENFGFALNTNYNPTVDYQANWSCESGCLQITLGGTPSQWGWSVTIDGPNPSTNSYPLIDGQSSQYLLINLDSGEFANVGQLGGTVEDFGCTWTTPG